METIEKKERLSNIIKVLFGKEVTIQEISPNDTLKIEIRNGFNSNAQKTFKLLGAINEIFDEYPNIKKAVTEDNYCSLELTRN